MISLISVVGKSMGNNVNDEIIILYPSILKHQQILRFNRQRRNSIKYWRFIFEFNSTSSFYIVFQD